MKMPYRVACERSSNRESVGKSVFESAKKQEKLLGQLEGKRCFNLLAACSRGSCGSVSSGRQCEQWQPSIPRVTRAQSSVPHNQDAKCCPKGSGGAVRATFMPHSAFPLPIAFAYTVPSRRCAPLCMQGVNICICNNNILMACPKCVRKSKRDLLLLLLVRVSV